MVGAMSVVLGNLGEAVEHAKQASDIAQSTEKPRLGGYSRVLGATAELLRGDFGAALATANSLPIIDPAHVDGNAKALFGIGIGAAAALEADSDEQRFRDRLAESEPNPAALAMGDLLASVYGWRASESAYRAARSAGAPGSIVDSTIWGPVMVAAAARWGIEDETNEERVAELVERTDYARGRALLAQAQGLRAQRRNEHAKAERLLFDAMQAFATLDLEYERTVALADHARALAAQQRLDEAASERAEVRAYAERTGAKALLGTLEPTPAAV